MLNKLGDIKSNAQHEIQEADGLSVLESIRVKYLGKKGSLTEILRSMGSCPPEERPALGMQVNKVRALLEEQLTRFPLRRPMWGLCTQ